jgi:hypothetical protein
MASARNMTIVQSKPIEKAADMYEARANSLREAFIQLREEALALANMREAVLFKGTSTEHIVRSIKNGTATIEAVLKRVN